MQVEEQSGVKVGQSQKRLFHGWYIVFVGYLAHLGFSTSLPSTLGVFFKPMSEEFGWPRSYVSGVRSFETLMMGLLASLVGPLLDKHGTRTVLTIGGIITAIGISSQAFVNDPIQFFLVRGVIICTGTAAISHMVVSVAISNWFVRLRGRALGFSTAGLSTGKIIMAPLITFLMGIWGWREAWVVLGFMVLLLVPLASSVWIRRRPEDMGLRPDGDTPGDSGPVAAPRAPAGRHSTVSAEAVWTRGEAARTAAFWLIIVTFGVATIGSQGLALHTIPFLTDIGFSPEMAALALSTLSVFQLIGNLGWGFIIERLQIRYCAMVMFLIEAAGLALLLWLREPAAIVLGLICYGLSLSGTAVMQDVIWANYFGRLSLGTVRGIGMPILVLFSASGPIYFGYLYDVTGGYDVALMGFLAMVVISAGLVLACRPPQRELGS